MNAEKVKKYIDKYDTFKRHNSQEGCTVDQSKNIELELEISNPYYKEVVVTYGRDGI